MDLDRVYSNPTCRLFHKATRFMTVRERKQKGVLIDRDGKFDYWLTCKYPPIAEPVSLNGE